jgi:lysozyme family protein
MKHEYIEFFKDKFTDNEYRTLKTLVNNGYTKLLQTMLLDYSPNLVVDGIFGYHTLHAVLHIPEFKKDDFWISITKALLDIHSNKTSTTVSVDEKKKSLIMNFLFVWEGKQVHFLKGEKAPTTPLGVYCSQHKSSGPCKYLRELYNKYGLSFSNRRHARLLDKRISKYERQKLFDLAWEFYKEKYLNDYISLKLKDMPKSSLSYFSNSMNANKGIKGIQSAINVKVDGVLGPQTKHKLDLAIKKYDDDILNVKQLQYIRNWYCFLAYKSKRKKHFKQFIKGWLNRIHFIGCKVRSCK